MLHRRWLYGGVPLALLAIGLLIGFGSARADEGFKSEITWHTDLSKARELASTSGKPLYVTFRCIP